MNKKNQTIIIILIAITAFLGGCKSKRKQAQLTLYQLKDKITEAQHELQKLQKQTDEIYRENELKEHVKKIKSLTTKKEYLNNEIDKVSKELKIKQAENENKIAYYITFQLKQSHFTLDMGKHLKDAMNAVDFKIPVDKKFYDNVRINQEIVDDFRGGSFLMEGSIGNWKVKVIKKETVFL